MTRSCKNHVSVFALHSLKEILNNTWMYQEPRRHIIYLFALFVGLPVVVMVWFLQQDTDLYVRYGYPFLALYFSWAIWALLRQPVSLRLIEQLTFWLVTVFWLGLMTFTLYGEPDLAQAWQALSPSVYLNFALFAVLAHLVFAPRTGLLASLVLVVGSTLVSLGRILPEVLQGQGMDVLTAFVRSEINLLLIAAFAFVVAKSKDDYAQAQVEAERMRVMAYHDDLTDLPNRRFMEDALPRLISMSQRHERPLSLIMFDIDHFKQVNDTYGHHVGDEVLRTIAVLVQLELRAGDVFGRWGGEEFMILAPETTKEQAQALAERIRKQIETHPFAFGMKITSSFGVVRHAPGTLPEELFEQADTLLYQAKEAGRNNVMSARFDIGSS